MARITDIILLQAQQQQSLVLSRTVAVTDIPDFLAEGFHSLASYLASWYVPAWDTPFMLLKGDDPNCLEVTMLQEFLIPAGKKLCCYWQGSSDEINAVYEEM